MFEVRQSVESLLFEVRFLTVGRISIVWSSELDNRTNPHNLRFEVRQSIKSPSSEVRSSTFVSILIVWSSTFGRRLDCSCLWRSVEKSVAMIDARAYSNSVLSSSLVIRWGELWTRTTRAVCCLIHWALHPPSMNPLRGDLDPRRLFSCGSPRPRIRSISQRTGGVMMSRWPAFVSAEPEVPVTPTRLCSTGSCCSHDKDRRRTIPEASFSHLISCGDKKWSLFKKTYMSWSLVWFYLSCEDLVYSDSIGPQTPSSSRKGTERAGSDNWSNVIVHKIWLYIIIKFSMLLMIIIINKESSSLSVVIYSITYLDIYYLFIYSFIDTGGEAL